MKRALVIVSTLVLTACGDGGLSDLKTFVAESGQDMQGKIDAPPVIKPYAPFTYDAFDLPDPFRPRKLSAPGSGSGLQPDFNRPREPLEAYSLETLGMVGVIARKNVIHAIIRTPDNAVYHIKAGNYMGQNFGLVTRITDSEVELREIVEDSAGDWSERTSTLVLPQ